MTRTKWLKLTAALALSGALVACGDDDAPMTTPDAGADAGGELDGGPPDDDAGPGDAGSDEDGGGDVAVPDTYAFDSRFTPGTSSVSYGGQVARNVLALRLRSFIDGLDARIADGSYAPLGDDTMAETVLADLEYFFGNEAAARAEDPHGLSAGTGLTFAQETWGDLSGTAYLLEKVAGNDTSTDHRDWSTEFSGYAPSSTALFRGDSPSVASPTALLRAIFATIAANADDKYNDVSRTGPDGAELPVHLTASGMHLGQLAEKFLFGALAFSQAADDYLDDEAEDTTKGLLAPNTRAGTSAYTELEHAWDEGFGYFGAPRHVSQIELADVIGASRSFDANSDSEIDITSEYLFPTARYAGLRDDGSAASARTSFLADADLAFRTGRTIIVNAGETLTAEELEDLREQRDIIVQSWERTLAANTVSYLNRVIQHTRTIDDTDPATTYSFASHAAAWSEMKGFALAFQFHRSSPMLVEEGGEERFVTLHELLGDAPVLETATPAQRAQYVTDLLAARALLVTAYGFDAANVGGDDGTGGW